MGKVVRRMKIKIKEELPVAEIVRPKVGSVHEVVGKSKPPMKSMYFIQMGGAQVGVEPGECEVVEP